jgi:hypothetical protein
MAIERRILPYLFSLLLLPALPSGGEPLDLANPQPRWVHVQFEASPDDHPARLDGFYEAPSLAWLEPGPLEGQVRVSVPAAAVEAVLFRGAQPVPGSFSDFVWIFDVETGHVASASVSGRVVETLQLGVFSRRVEADLEARMNTRTTVGYTPPRLRLGQRIFGYCTDPRDADCTLVPAAPYDPRSGYVNAVGAVVARSIGFESRTFSPLGEARFAERPSAPIQTASQILDEHP